MAFEDRILLLVCAFTVSCGGPTSTRLGERPTLKARESEAPPPVPLGANAPRGFLRPCQTLRAGDGVVELSCGEHQVVEFRQVEVGEQGEGLDGVMTILRARFGELEDSRFEARIDGTPVPVAQFQGDGETAITGMATLIANTAGQFWALACYRKAAAANAAFCGEAIATAARAGGLAHTEAKPIQSVMGNLRVPAGCRLVSGHRISCGHGELSWAPEDGRDAVEVRDETIARLRELAAQQRVGFNARQQRCELLGAEAQCRSIRLSNETAGDSLNFFLATGGGQPRLLICSYPGVSLAPLPVPCDQAIRVLPGPSPSQ